MLPRQAALDSALTERDFGVPPALEPSRPPAPTPPVAPAFVARQVTLDSALTERDFGVPPVLEPSRPPVPPPPIAPVFAARQATLDSALTERDFGVPPALEPSRPPVPPPPIAPAFAARQATVDSAVVHETMTEPDEGLGVPPVLEPSRPPVPPPPIAPAFAARQATVDSAVVHETMTEPDEGLGVPPVLEPSRPPAPTPPVAPVFAARQATVDSAVVHETMTEPDEGLGVPPVLESFPPPAPTPPVAPVFAARQATVDSAVVHETMTEPDEGFGVPPVLEPSRPPAPPPPIAPGFVAWQSTLHSAVVRETMTEPDEGFGVLPEPIVDRPLTSHFSSSVSGVARQLRPLISEIALTPRRYNWVSWTAISITLAILATGLWYFSTLLGRTVPDATDETNPAAPITSAKTHAKHSPAHSRRVKNSGRIPPSAAVSVPLAKSSDLAVLAPVSDTLAKVHSGPTRTARSSTGIPPEPVSPSAGSPVKTAGLAGDSEVAALPSSPSTADTSSSNRTPEQGKSSIPDHLDQNLQAQTLAVEPPSGPEARSSAGSNGDATATSKAPGPSPAQSAPGEIRTGGHLQQAQLIFRTVPTYPPNARRVGVEGTVHILCLVDRDGTVKRLAATSGHPLLRDAAVQAVRRWRFNPASLNGMPVEMELEVDVKFTLR